MSMRRWYVAGCAAVIAYMLAYMTVDYAKLPRLVYDQLRHSWSFAVPTGLPSGFVGQWLWATAAAAAVGGATFGLLGKRSVSERTLGFMLAWTLTAVALAAAYFAWMNWP